MPVEIRTCRAPGWDLNPQRRRNSLLNREALLNEEVLQDANARGMKG